MPTKGYGEDGLTYHALHARRAEVLERFQHLILDHEGVRDETPPEQCLVYFRPSFGRAGGPRSPQFGEFDAILCTSELVYLIECKWDGGNPPGAAVILPEVQRVRHLIFTWLYDNWCQLAATGAEPTWASFVQERGQAFTQAFPDRRLAPETRLLARNLRNSVGAHAATSPTAERAALLPS